VRAGSRDGRTVGPSVRSHTGLSLRRAWPAVAVFLLALAVYVVTLCPTVFVEGAGENIICAWTLGVPHPPGFPLFCLLAKAFALAVRVGSVAYRINLFAAVMGAVAAAALYLLLTELSIGSLASACAALSFSFSSTFWREATIAEVYTLSTALVVLQIWLLLRWRRGLAPAGGSHTQVAPENQGRRRRRAETASAALTRSDRPLLWFGLAFGLGLAVHYNHLLLLPAYAYFILSTDSSLLKRWRSLPAVVGLVLAGFALHLYAPIRSAANPPIDWGDPQTIRNWWPYLTAEQYRGRMFHLPLPEVIGNLRDFARSLPAQLTYPGLALAALGAVALLRNDRRLLYATALMVVAAVLWAINYDIPWEIEVYYLPALLAMALWLGFGLDAALRWSKARRLLPAAAALALAVPTLALALNFGPNDLSHQRFVMDNALDAVAAVEPNAAIILPSTNPTFSLLYLTRVERQATGLALWSRCEGGVASVEEAIHPHRTLAPEPRFIAEQLAKGRPVYTIERQPAGSLAGFGQVPWDCLYRIVPASERAAWMAKAPDALHAPHRFQPDRQRLRYGAEQALLACRYLLVQADYAWEHQDRGLADKLYGRALAIGEELPSVAAQVASRYVEQGRSEQAAQVCERALRRHGDAALHNQLGAIYGRAGRLDDAQRQFEQAIALEPRLAEAHANLASVYGQRGEIERAIKELELALSYEPGNLLALRNLAFAYAQTGRTDEARELLQRSLEVNPRQQDVRDQLRLLTDGQP
jgi:tetratricopeptide (TPR) repeat protein